MQNHKNVFTPWSKFIKIGIAMYQKQTQEVYKWLPADLVKDFIYF